MSNNFTPRYVSEKDETMRPHTTYTQMFIETKNPNLHQLMDKVWNIHTLEHYSEIKKINEVPINATTSTNHENIMLSEKNSHIGPHIV